MWFFKRKLKIDYEEFISRLEKGNERDIKDLLWQPKDNSVQYLPLTTKLIQKLKKPESSTQRLSIYKQIENGNFELIIFNTPWEKAFEKNDIPYSPLIIEKTTGKIVGIMLMLNELHTYLSHNDNKKIGELGTKWVLFALGLNSKK